MSAPAILDSAVCMQRADESRRTAELLRDAGNEWAAVCYFYAGYHTVRAAILADPVFGSVTDLSKLNPNLTIGDQTVTRHQGRIVAGRPRDLGVNDLVDLLYPRIRANYKRMHGASISVRYGQGLGAVLLSSVEADHDRVREAYDAGSLRAVFK